MPIRPEMRALYPPEWPLISDYIRFDRAMGRCECDGRCGSPMHSARINRSLLDSTVWPDRCPNYHGDPSQFTGSRVVLTTMHLDHDPTNCDPANLMAGCQACHLAYDAIHHAVTAAATREAKKKKRGDQMTLFDEDQDGPPPPMTRVEIPQFENDGQAIAWLGVDAARWTAMFLRATDLANAGPDFQHSVFGWFCNAIGAGQSAAFQTPPRNEWFSDAVTVEEIVEPGGWLRLNLREGDKIASCIYDKGFGKATHAALTKWLYPEADVLPTVLSEWAKALRGDWSQDGRALKLALDELVGWMRDPATAPDVTAIRARLDLCPAGDGHWTEHCEGNHPA